MQRVTLISMYDEYCLGVRYMSALLQREGHSVHVILFKGVEFITPRDVPPPERQEEGGYYAYASYVSRTELELVLDLLRKQEPHLVGISFSSINFGVAQFLTEQIRKRLGVPVIWGGVDSTINPETNIPYTDMLCVGEGEYPLLNLVNAMDRGKDITCIPSIWVNRDGTIYRNPVMKLEQNPDKYPFPDFEPANKTLILNDRISEALYPPHSHLYTNFMIMGARGCPFTCSYCCSGHYRKIYKGDCIIRQRSPENVIRELEYRLETWPWPLQRVEFYDDVLPANKAWIREFSPLYAERVGLPFFGYTHPNVGDPENLALLQKAGLHYLIMGIQSGSQRVLKEVLNRRHTKERTIQTAQNILDTGAKLLVDFIGYNPLVREEDNVETLELLCDLPRPFGIIKINPMAYYDNYVITEIAMKEGILDQLERPKGVHAYQAIMKPEYIFWEYLHTLAQFDGFTKEHLMGLAKDGYLRENPEILEEIVTNFYRTTYQGGNPVAHKDQYIDELHRRLAEFENSRIMAVYRKAGNWLRGRNRMKKLYRFLRRSLSRNGRKGPVGFRV